MVDQKLTWIDHIAHVKHKIAHGLGIINKAKPFSPKKKYKEFMLFVYIPIFNVLCGSLGQRIYFPTLTTMLTSK